MTDRFDGILPSPLDQRTADERDWRKRVERAKLADRVRDIDLGVCSWKMTQ